MKMSFKNVFRLVDYVFRLPNFKSQKIILEIIA